MSGLPLAAMKPLTAIVGVVIAVAAAILLNVVLLNRASSSSDPVGKLTPSARLPGQSRRLPPAPAGVVQPATGPVEGEGNDD